MTRPSFLTSPGVWIRTPRSTKSIVDDACSVEHSVPHVSRFDRVAGVIVAIGIGVMLASLLWHGLAS